MLSRRCARTAVVASLVVAAGSMSPLQAPRAQPATEAQPSAQSQPPTRMQRSGGLRAEQIRQVIQRHIEDVQRCYEVGLVAVPGMQGRVTLHFTIEADGHVHDAHVASESLAHAPTAECVAHVADAWIYDRPEPPGDVTVFFPFNLSNEGPLEAPVRCVDRTHGLARRIAMPDAPPADAPTDPEAAALVRRRPTRATVRATAIFLQQHPTHPDADRTLLALADGLRITRQTASATEAYAVLVSRGPTHPLAPYAHAALGRMALEAGRYEEANRAYELAFASGGVHTELEAYALVMIALARAELCDHAETRRALASAERLFETHPEWHARLGRSTQAFDAARSRLLAALPPAGDP